MPSSNDDAAEKSTTTANIAIIVIGVVAALIALGLLVVGILYVFPMSRIVPRPLPPTTSVEAVVSAYREDLSWLRQLPLPVTSNNTTIYSKHPDTAVFDGKQSIALPNVGRCDHTYLYHIVQRYDSLPDITLFMTGSTNEIWHKRYTLRWLVLPRLGSRARFLGCVVPLLGANSFQIKNYRATSRANRPVCTKLDRDKHSDDSRRKFGNSDGDGGDVQENSCARRFNTVIPAQVRPFARWWRTRFPERRVPSLCSLYGVFAATRESIRSVPIDVWRTLLREHEVGDNLEVGHFMERSWFELLTCDQISNVADQSI